MSKNPYNKKVIVAASWASLLLFGVTIVSAGSFLPYLAIKYNLDSLDKASLATALPGGILLGSLVFGPIVDRFSYRYLLAASMFLIAAGMELMAFTSNFLWVQVAFFLIGAGGGAINGAGSALVADMSEDFGENKGANLSILGAFYGLGALGTPALLATLTGIVDHDFFVASIGIIACIPTISYFFITFPRPKHPQGLHFSELLKLASQPTILLLGLVLFFQSGLESLTNNWATSFWIGAFQLPAKDALIYLTVFSLSFTMGRLGLGYLLRKVNPFTLFLTSMIVAGAGSVLMGNSSSPFLIYTAMALLGFGLACGFPVVFGAVTTLFSNLSGSALGLILSMALTGNILANYLMGWLAQVYGIEKLPMFITVMIVLELMVLLAAIRVMKRASS